MPGEISNAYGHTDRPTIEDAKEVQRRLHKGDFHVVWFDRDGFVMAHTDDERASKDEVPLTDCVLHILLCSLNTWPVNSEGWYFWFPAAQKFVKLPKGEVTL